MHTESLAVAGFRLHAGLHEAGAEIAPHAHDDPTLCYLISGRFTEYSRTKSVDCINGTMKLMPAGEVHWNRFVAASTRGLRIDIDRARFAQSSAIATMLDGHHVFDLPGTRAIMHRIIAEMDAGDDASSIVIEGLLLELLGELGRSSSRRVRRPTWLQLADDAIRERFLGDISVAGLAESVGISAVAFARAYRAHFHVSPGERVRQLRLEHAANALIAGTDPISIIAANAGFYDQSHFTTAFKRRYALTPARFRALHLDGKRA